MNYYAVLLLCCLEKEVSVHDDKFLIFYIEEPATKPATGGGTPNIWSRVDLLDLLDSALAALSLLMVSIRFARLVTVVSGAGDNSTLTMGEGEGGILTASELSSGSRGLMAGGRPSR